MRPAAFAIVSFLIIASPPALLAKTFAATSSPIIEGVRRCKQIAGESERLMCLDSSTTALVNASDQGELIVIDQAAIRQTRRSAFGFAKPRLPLSDNHKTGVAEAVLETRITNVRSLANGLYRFRIANGDALWETSESWVRAEPPSPGDEVIIRRGSFGGYLLDFKGQPKLRGRRVG